MPKTIYVSPDGHDGNNGLSGTAPLQQINAALGIAQEGDTISLAPGPYEENVNVRVPGLTWRRTDLDSSVRPQIRLVDVEAPGNAFISIDFGTPNSTSYLVRLNRGAHETRISECVFDAHDIEICRPLTFRVPSTKPFGEDAASRCVVRDCTFTRGRMISMLDLFGDDNVVEHCTFSDSANVDWTRVHGRRNTVRDCLFFNSYQVEGGNHPDFFQCFSDPQNDGKGWGSYGHVIERNHVRDCPNMQLTQMSNMGRLSRDQHGSITFRNNLFEGVGLQASCTIPDVHYLNNTFVRCNTVNEGPVLSFGKRGYEGAEVPSGSIQEGVSYRVSSADGQGTVTYAGVEMNRRTQFNGVAGQTTYGTTGDAKVVEFPLTWATGAKAVGNIFLDCGSPKRGTSGWYALDPDLKEVEFDYNYVSKTLDGAPFQPVKSGARPPGDPEWTLDDSYRFFEEHGVNGGDPGMVAPEEEDFTLQETSILAGRLPAPYVLATDFYGDIRNVPTSIGCHEPNPLGVPASPPEPPPVDDPLDLVVVTKVHKSGRAESETHKPPFTLEVK